MSLQNILNLLGGGVERNNQRQGQMIEATTNLKEGTVQASEAQARIAQSEGTIASLSYQGELAAQTNSRRAASSMGTNMDMDNQIVTMLGERMRESGIKASNQASKVARMEARSGLGNPFGLLYNILYGDEERGKRDAYMGEFETNKDILNNLNQSTTLSAQTQNAIAETKSDAGLFALNEATAASVDVIRGELQKSLAGADINLIQTLGTMDTQGLNMALQGYEAKERAVARAVAAQERADNRKYRDAQTDLAIANAELLRQQREMNLKQSEETAQGQKESIEQYNAGLLESNSTEAPITTFQQLRTRESADRNKTLTLMNLGAQRLVAGKSIKGADPSDAIDTIRIVGANLNPVANATASKVASVMGTAISTKSLVDTYSSEGVNLANVQDKLKDEEFIHRAKVDAIRSKAAGDLAVISPGDANNLYQLPSLEYFANDANAVAYMESRPFLRDKILPLAVAGGAEFNGQRFLDLAAVASMEGLASTADLTDDINWLASSGIAANNGLNEYQSNFALPIQRTANMAVRTSSGNILRPSEVSIVNLADPTEVTRALVKSVRSLSVTGVMSGGTYIPNATRNVPSSAMADVARVATEGNPQGTGFMNMLTGNTGGSNE